MRGTEFRKRIKKLAKSRKVDCGEDKHHGKGSHTTLYYGDKKTTVKNGEIGEGLLNDMLKQLGLTKKDFYE